MADHAARIATELVRMVASTHHPAPVRRAVERSLEPYARLVEQAVRAALPAPAPQPEPCPARFRGVACERQKGHDGMIPVRDAVWRCEGCRIVELHGDPGHRACPNCGGRDFVLAAPAEAPPEERGEDDEEAPGGSGPLPCPFCGGPADPFQSADRWGVRCAEDCSVELFDSESRSEVEAVAKWNRRAAALNGEADSAPEKCGPACDRALEEVIAERDRREEQLEQIYWTLGGSREDAWVCLLPPEAPPNSGDAGADALALAEDLRAELAAARQQEGEPVAWRYECRECQHVVLDERAGIRWCGLCSGDNGRDVPVSATALFARSAPPPAVPSDETELRKAAREAEAVLSSHPYDPAAAGTSYPEVKRVLARLRAALDAAPPGEPENAEAAPLAEAPVATSRLCDGEPRLYFTKDGLKYLRDALAGEVTTVYLYAAPPAVEPVAPDEDEDDPLWLEAAWWRCPKCNQRDTDPHSHVCAAPPPPAMSEEGEGSLRAAAAVVAKEWRKRGPMGAPELDRACGALDKALREVAR